MSRHCFQVSSATWLTEDVDNIIRPIPLVHNRPRRVAHPCAYTSVRAEAPLLEDLIEPLCIAGLHSLRVLIHKFSTLDLAVAT
jgi:hypothetical protein